MKSGQRVSKLIPATGAVVLVAAILQGCLGSGIFRPVKASDKDSSGVFDGTWDTVVKSTETRQTIAGNWVANCNDLAGTQLPRMSVQDGEIALQFRNNRHTTFLNSSGQFRFEIPMEGTVSESSRSDTAISDGALTFILCGSLESKTGFQTFGVAQFANAGCTSKTTLVKV